MAKVGPDDYTEEELKSLILGFDWDDEQFIDEKIQGMKDGGMYVGCMYVCMHVCKYVCMYV